MVALVIEVRPDFVTKKLTMKGVEYEESWYNDECKNPITKQLRERYPDMSEYDMELAEEALCSNIDAAQEALQDLEDFFESF